MTRRLATLDPVTVRIPPDTLRELDDAWADALGAMMAADGQAEPIEVAEEKGGTVLVFGLHRLVGAQRRKLRIDALVDAEGGSATARRRRAIHENLGRHLSKLDRAVHIGALHGLIKEERGVGRGGDRLSDAARSKLQKLQFGLAAEVAERVGLSERSVAIAVSIAGSISLAVRRRIVTTAALRRLADSQNDLERLAAESPARQARILDILADDNRAETSVADAIAALDGKRKPPETERQWALAENAFARLQGRTRDRFLAAHEQDFLDWQRRKGKRG